MPTQSEIKARIDAARTLRGLTQKDFAARLSADGLGKHDLGRIERGDLDLQRVHRDTIERHLRIPDWWLTAEAAQFDRLLAAPRRQPSADQLRAAAELVIAVAQEALQGPDTP